MGRVNSVPVESRAIISAILYQLDQALLSLSKLTIEVSNDPARRGKTFFPTAVCAPKRCVMDLEGRNLARKGVTSGMSSIPRTVCMAHSCTRSARSSNSLSASVLAYDSSAAV